MTGARSGRALGAWALALAAVFFVALNVFSETAFRGVRLDLTERGLFTLSDGTRQTLAAVREPIVLRFFATRELLDGTPGLSGYASRVRELLRRYVALSGGAVRLELVDPEPFSPEEDRAVGFGLTGVPLTEAGDLGYFGVVGTNSTDDADVLAFLSPQRERFLEYDLTRMIHNLANPKKKVMALVTGIPVDSDPLKKYKPWRLIDELKQFFEVRTQGLTPKLADDVDLLMVVHPFGLGERARYEIDQFVLRGGKAIVLVDPHAEEGGRSNQALRLPPGIGSDLPGLLEAWGLAYDKDKVLGDLQAGQRVQAGVDSFGRPVITRYVAWTTYGPKNFQTRDVVASELELLNFMSPGFFETVEGATAKVEPLVWSTDSSGPFDANSVRHNPQPAEILKEFAPRNRRHVIAARVSGEARSAFPDGPPKPDGGAGEDGKADAPARPHLAEGEVNVIAVADTDFIADSAWLQVQELFGQELAVPTASNAGFVVNAADNLAGSSALIGLRGRGLSVRPFEAIERIQDAADEKYRAQERALAKELEDVNAKLRRLETSDRAEGAAVLSPEQEKEIAEFRKRAFEIRRELRRVQLDLRRDIDRLEAGLKLVNIAAMPAAVAVFAVAVLLVRRNRKRERA